MAGVPELNIHGAPMAALVPADILEKSIVSLETKELFQRFTFVAVDSDVVSYVTTPIKSMLPLIGPAAWACWPKRPQRATTARRARIAFGKAFMGLVRQFSYL